jgi:hypothetical protein
LAKFSCLPPPSTTNDGLTLIVLVVPCEFDVSVTVADADTVVSAVETAVTVSETVLLIVPGA